MTAPVPGHPGEAVLVGLVDSGVAEDVRGRMAGMRRFRQDPDGAIVNEAATPDFLGHGTLTARLLLQYAGTAELLCAQVFDERGVTTPATVAAGLGWLVEQGARVINLSLGLTEDRAVLRAACADAIAAGAWLAASVPILGARVFPAAYPGVVRVTGDARCQHWELSALDGARADFGACPWPAGAPPEGSRPRGQGVSGIAGASMAAARVSGALARMLAMDPAGNPVDGLRRLCAYHGPQTRPVSGKAAQA
jgi:hypothetical protein